MTDQDTQSHAGRIARNGETDHMIFSQTPQPALQHLLELAHSSEFQEQLLLLIEEERDPLVRCLAVTLLRLLETASSVGRTGPPGGGVLVKNPAFPTFVGVVTSLANALEVRLENSTETSSEIVA